MRGRTAWLLCMCGQQGITAGTESHTTLYERPACDLTAACRWGWGLRWGRGSLQAPVSDSHCPTCKIIMLSNGDTELNKS